MWELVDQQGKVLDSGNLGLNTTVMQGYDMTSGKDGILRFTIEVKSHDIAGNYSGKVSLSGMTF